MKSLNYFIDNKVKAKGSWKRKIKWYLTRGKK